MDLDMQIKLFETGLDELDQNCDLINQVLEITLDDANNAEFTIIRYELPSDKKFRGIALSIPRRSSRKDPQIAGPGPARAITRCWGKPSLGDDLV